MSKNINQVYIANPITSNAATDLMYFGQSPYGLTNDAAMTYANFAAQFGSPYTPAAMTEVSDTNVTLTLGGTPATSLLHAVSLTMGWSGTLSGARGGLAAAITASNGGIYYSTATTGALLAGTATALLPLLSGSTAAPTWGAFALSMGGAITTAGALTTVGAFGVTFTFTGITGVTFPTSGTLATTAGTVAVATTVATTAVSNNATYYPVMVSATSGNQAIDLVTAFTFNPSTGVLTATTFAGALSGNATTATTATNANNVATTAVTANASYYPLMVASSTNENQVVDLVAAFTFNPSTGSLTATTFIGALTGNADTATTAAACSGNSATATTITSIAATSLYGNSTGSPANGQAITLGTGLSFSGSTLNVTSSAFVWNDVSGTTQAASGNNGYIISNAGQTTVTIPATIGEGQEIGVQGKGAAGWILHANTGQTIHFGSSASSSAGSLTSTNQWDSVRIVCVTANTTFAVTNVIGNLTVA